MSEPASFLPREIQQHLKRKSSRDLNSRFTAKLHTLLTYVTQHPSRENDVGLAWTSDTEFKMNKKTLTQVMGIKLNTINVNLRDLGFEEKQRGKDGWTRWTKEGFTRKGFSSGTGEIVPMTFTKTVQEPQMRIGACTPDEEQEFFRCAHAIWGEMLPGVVIGMHVQATRFIDLAAETFRTPEQPPNNAVAVIKAIIAPNLDEGGPAYLGFAELCRLLAMFGPRQTLMLKIAHLLQCSADTGNWMQFNDTEPVHTGKLSGQFSIHEPNCLVLMWPSGRCARVWNLPLVDANGPYIVDEGQIRYLSWNQYFQDHPMDAYQYP